MNKSFLLFAVSCFIAVSLCAQEPGYFGKTTFIEIGGQGQLPVLLNAFHREKGFTDHNGTLHKSYNLLDVGIRGAIGTTLSENFGIAVEYNHRFYRINPLRGGELNRQYTDSSGNFVEQYIRPQVALIDIQERTILPKLVFTSGSGRMPAGLVQELGVGYCIVGITNREPLVAGNGTGEFSSESVRKNLIDQEVDELKGLVLLYGLKMNYALSRNFLLSVGVRYSYSWLMDKKGFRKTEQTQAWLSGREIWSRVNQHRQLGVLTFGIGGVICL